MTATSSICSTVWKAQVQGVWVMIDVYGDIQTHRQCYSIGTSAGFCGAGQQPGQAVLTYTAENIDPCDLASAQSLAASPRTLEGPGILPELVGGVRKMTTNPVFQAMEHIQGLGWLESRTKLCLAKEAQFKIIAGPGGQLKYAHAWDVGSVPEDMMTNNIFDHMNPSDENHMSLF